MIRLECDKRFRELIDRSFVEEVSEGERQLIHDHIRDCGDERFVELTAHYDWGLQKCATRETQDWKMSRSVRFLRILVRQCASTTCNSRSGCFVAIAISMSIVGDGHLFPRWPSS